MSTIEGGYQADPDLRARIQAFSPDEPGVVFPFSARLAQENGWTREHARRVTREYLRFVYLAMTAGHPVTPSLPVDEAWHLHLTYTRSYWEEMCGRVLGRPLHHEPTRGGAAEEAKFADWYARTLASYRTAFGEEPPLDVWPRPAEKEATPPAAAGPPRRRRFPALLAVTLIIAVSVGACTGEEVWSVVFGGVILLFGMFVAHAAAPEPRWLSRPDAGKAGTRRKAAGTSDGADAGCGSDGGVDSGHHGGCSGHSGCGGHGGCGHGGCHGGCGGGGCGSH